MVATDVAVEMVDGGCKQLSEVTGTGCKYAELPRKFYGQAFRRAWVKYGFNIEI